MNLPQRKIKGDNMSATTERDIGRLEGELKGINRRLDGQDIQLKDILSGQESLRADLNERRGASKLAKYLFGGFGFLGGAIAKHFS